MILFDTDICIEILRGNKKIVDRRNNTDSEVAISFMTVGELYFGAEKSSNIENNLVLIDAFLLIVRIIESDPDIMKRFGQIKALLKTRNEIISDADILIGATALVKCDLLITGNVDHFRRIDNLKIENWIR